MCYLQIVQNTYTHIYIHTFALMFSTPGQQKLA